MYLSAERLALANQTVRETFEQSSVVWQAIPHWDVGDRGQTMVTSDTVPPSAPLAITLGSRLFSATVAEATAATPDALLTKVIDQTRKVADNVDHIVLETIRSKITTLQDYYDPDKVKTLSMLIKARATVEAAGYRAPSCVFVETQGLIDLSTVFADSGYPGTDLVLGPANINSLHRVEDGYLDPAPLPAKKTHLIFLGRRQRIPQGQAMDASPGEEPVDLAVTVPPTLEVIGPNPDGTIALAIKAGGAVRVKDPKGLVALHK